MRSRRRFGILVFVALLSITSLALAQEDARYPVMRADKETMRMWQREFQSMPPAEIDQEIKFFLGEAQALNYSTSMDLLGDITYDPNQRNQGGCGNCWVWAGTGVLEIAHSFNDGVLERLSTQYFDSCNAGDPCCGGNLGAFVNWYSSNGFVIPWDNTNASFADASRGCGDPKGVACGTISATPQFPINSIQEQQIETYGKGQATAISNIKAILNANRGVYYGFALPNSTAWSAFFDFWDGVGISGSNIEGLNVWNPDTYCGTEWNQAPNQAGGHAVVILGYNDDDTDTSKHYWLALNSWGTAASGRRPNGLFRIKMYSNYDCVYPDTDQDSDPDIDTNWLANGYGTITVQFGNAPPTADPGGPYTKECQGPTTTLSLTATNSTDPEGFTLAYSWTSTCPGAAFSDISSGTPNLTVDSSACSVNCSATLTVTDNGGLTATATASVSVADTAPPTITCPGDKVVECSSSSAPSATGQASASDICHASPVIGFSDLVADGACPQAKLITRTFTATDSCTNAASCSQSISVVDTTSPTFQSPPGPITVECDAVPAAPELSALDNCDSNLLYTFLETRQDGTCSSNYVLTRKWTATDHCSNATIHTQLVTVRDTTAPMIQCNAPLTIKPNQVPLSYTATATDNCSSPVVEITGFDCFDKRSKLESCVVEFSGNRISILDSGGVGDKITWNVKATDGCGNVSSTLCGVEVVNPGKK